MEDRWRPEHGTSATEQMGAFPQVAGITYAIDLEGSGFGLRML